MKGGFFMFLEDVYKEFLLGLDVYSLSRLLGHESTVITSRYLQSLNDENIVNLASSISPVNEYREKSKIKEKYLYI